MTIKTKLKFDKYLKLMFILTYRKPSIIILTSIGVLMLISASMTLFGVVDSYYKEGVSPKPPIAEIIIGFMFIIIFPLMTYLNARKMFSSSGRLQEEITYEFSDDRIKITGETFKSEMDWTKTYKVLELNDWILIYQNRIVANVIPKELFGDNLNEFKAMIKSKNIKSKLK